MNLKLCLFIISKTEQFDFHLWNNWSLRQLKRYSILKTICLKSRRGPIGLGMTIMSGRHSLKACYFIILE